MGEEVCLSLIWTCKGFVLFLYSSPSHHLRGFETRNCKSGIHSQSAEKQESTSSSFWKILRTKAGGQARSVCSLQKHEEVRGRAVKTLNMHIQHMKVRVVIRKLKRQAPGSHGVKKPFTPAPFSVKKLFCRTNGSSLSMTSKIANESLLSFSTPTLNLP